ncbi:MDR family MFS transporter [Nocardiopsis metallicus]|uniref:EmrB/QacA subfamily drug resistance transporter n=1 Tax=Nocardiopsis metallicus TaxID=179819 RepID=A0A840WQF8_9ACTN|nr:MDR family MFS transporter [Nocardiopsis metallicus]MBB5494085.1 EmrB/QacA subfamily drug resistance transporter [Nocardiopsis metallicus]
MSTPQTPVSEGERPASKAAGFVLTGLFIGVFLSALDTMIMATALRTIADQLSGMTGQAWVTVSYLVAMTASAPLYGKMSDIFGRKRLYLVAISVFVLGSALCAFAQSIYELSAYRAVQGLGAGGLMTLALAITADLFTPERRVRHQANLGLMFGVASVAGPVGGGLFAGMDTLLWVDGWRWVFLINLPLGLFCFLVVARYFQASAAHRARRRVDVLGAVLLVLAVIPALVAVEQGREWGWWSPTVLSLYALSLLGLVAFLLTERRMADAAILPPRLFRSRSFSMVNAVNFLGGMGVFGALTVLPLYLQVVQGLSPTTAGLLLLPQSVFTTIGSYVCGPVTERTGRSKPLLVAGVAIMSASYLALAFMDAQTHLALVVVVVSFMGVGLGFFFQTVLIALQTSVEPKDIGVASGLYSFTRQLGGAVGAALFVSLLFTAAVTEITKEAGTAEFSRAAEDPEVMADPDNRAAVDTVREGVATEDLDDTSFLQRVHPDIAAPYIDGLDNAMSTVFLTMSAFVLLSAITALLIPERRGGSGKPESPEQPEPKTVDTEK